MAMSRRLNISEARFAWFENDLTVCTLNMDGEIWALPQIEVVRGLLYLERLMACKTIGQAQELYEGWLADPQAPKFLPKELVDLKLEVDEPWESQVNNSFNFLDSPYYRDENDVFVTIGRPQLWTDFWMPQEIVDRIGQSDHGYGVDYIPAEYLYRDARAFKAVFEEHGFAVIENDPRLRKIAGY
jgi:hypothetical protein